MDSVLLAEVSSAGMTLGHWVSWLVAFATSIVALVFAYRFHAAMVAADGGEELMVKIAKHVKDGAKAYLFQQYKVVIAFFVVIGILLAILAFGFGAQSRFVPFAFLSGGFFSGLAGWIGMMTATSASNRTTAGARNSLNQGLQIAFRSGAVMGLTVVGLGLIDITAWFLLLKYFHHAPEVVRGWFNVTGPLSLEDITVTMLCFGMGASSQALFARVGGGIFTKAADVGADLVGKVEAGIPEDDPRNPATIADNVGDNVGDVAGMGADLYESYCGSILASAALGVAAMNSLASLGSVEESQALSALLLPMVLAGVGIILSILGIYWVRTEENADQETLLKALARGINLSTVLIVVSAFLIVFLMLGLEFWGLVVSIVFGLLSGWVIGKWTEYSTSDVYKPTQQIADQALYGPATVIIAGMAEGMQSVWVPALTVCVAMLGAFSMPILSVSGMDFDAIGMASYASLGLFGIGVAAVGMLSTLGITLATDAYGPIADNAGGNAEMSHQPKEVRQRTDALDSLGNTTAATGKGFAIGSAALTALALLAAYIEEVRVGYVRWGRQMSTDAAVVATIEKDGYYPIKGDVVLVPVTTEVETPAAGQPDADAEEKDAAEPEEDATPAEGEADGASDPEATAQPYEVAMRFYLDPGGDKQEQIAAGQYRDVPMAEATMTDFVHQLEVNPMNPRFLVGSLIGAMLVFWFSALTMKAVGRAAGKMVAEVRRQFKEIPGIMEGTSEPDYAECVTISTKEAQREMVAPSLLGLLAPLVGGIALGVAGVMGILVGTLVTGFTVAIMMANAGGAWDNAKKYIEGGAHGGKGSDAHKAGVVGDTVGDPFKDTSGPSINILIKLMSMVSVVTAGMIVRYALWG